MTNAQLQIVISARDQATATLNRVGQEVSKIGNKFSMEMSVIQGAANIAKKALIGFGAATTAAGIYAVKSAADFEQIKIAMTTMTGSAEKAGEVLLDVSKFAAETPFEFPELASTVKQLMAFGFNTEEAIGTMKRLGDIAAGLSIPIGDLAYLMGTMRAQGRAFTVDINQFANRGLPIYEELAKVLKVNTNQVRALVEDGKVGFPEVTKAIENMTNEGGKFFGMMSAQSTSFSGLMSTLKDNVGFALREIVGINLKGEVREGSIFDLLRQSAQKLVEWLDANKEKIAAAAQQFISRAVEKGREWINQMGGPEGITEKLKSIWQTIQNDVIPALVGFLSIVGTITKFLWEHRQAVLYAVAALELLKIFSVLTSLAAAFGIALGPFLIGGAVIVGLVAGVILLVKHWDQVKAKAKEIADAVSSAFRGMADMVKSAWQSVQDWIWSKIQAIVDRINKVISGYNRLPGSPNIPEIRFSSRAVGGSVMAGKPYMVGERGPEMFIPTQSGRIENNPVTNSRTEMVFNFNFSGAYIGDKDQFMREIQQAVNRKQELYQMGAI